MAHFSDYELNEIYWVHVTHIEDPHNFYVRRREYDDLLPQLEKPGDQLETVNVGDNVVYKCRSLDKHIRGQICSVSENRTKYYVFAMDYGFVDQCLPISTTFKAVSEETPPLAVFCELYMCDPIGGAFTKESIDAMRCFTAGEPAVITVKAVDSLARKLTVELENSRHDVATIMALANYSVLMARVPNMPQRKHDCRNIFHYKTKELDIGQVLHVRVQSGNQLSGFYVAEVSDYNKYKTAQFEFTDYYKNCPPVETLEIGQSIGVFHRSDSACRYERGIVMAILPDSRARIHLVDIGIDVIECFSDIRAVTQASSMVLPGIAIYCSTDKNQIWDNGLDCFLTPGYELKIKIIKLGKSGTPHLVDLIRIENN